jgi:hypothetical protein
MQELAVEVVERSGHVRLGDLREPHEHQTGRGAGRHARVQLHTRLGRHAAGLPAHGLDRLVEKRPDRLLGSERLPDEVLCARERAVIAPYRLHPQARRQRDAASARSLHRQTLDGQARHGLGVVVEYSQRPRRRLHARHGKQRSLLQDAGQAIAQRPAREVRDAVPVGLGSADSTRRRARLGQGELAAGPVGLQARGTKPSIEAVEQDPVLAHRPAGLHVQGPGQLRIGNRRCQHELAYRGRHRPAV